MDPSSPALRHRVPAVHRSVRELQKDALGDGLAVPHQRGLGQSGGWVDAAVRMRDRDVAPGGRYWFCRLLANGRRGASRGRSSLPACRCARRERLGDGCCHLASIRRMPSHHHLGSYPVPCAALALRPSAGLDQRRVDGGFFVSGCTNRSGRSAPCADASPVPTDPPGLSLPFSY